MFFYSAADLFLTRIAPHAAGGFFIGAGGFGDAANKVAGCRKPQTVRQCAEGARAFPAKKEILEMLYLIVLFNS